MADPVLINIPADTWTLVASNVKTGNVWIVDSGPIYFQTYRDFGGAAPTTAAEAIPLPIPGRHIDSAIEIDIYILAKGKPGRVRVDTV